MARLDPVDIARDLDDAVRIMPGEVGTDAVPGDRRRFLRRHAGTDEQGLGDRLQAVGGDDGHGFPPAHGAGGAGRGTKRASDTTGVRARAWPPIGWRLSGRLGEALEEALVDAAGVVGPAQPHAFAAAIAGDELHPRRFEGGADEALRARLDR